MGNRWSKMSPLTIHAWLYSVSHYCFVRSLSHLRRIRSYLYRPVTVNFLFTSIRLSVRLDPRAYLSNTQNILNTKLTRLVRSLFLVKKHMTERLCLLGYTADELVLLFLAEERAYRRLLFSSFFAWRKLRKRCRRVLYTAGYHVVSSQLLFGTSRVAWHPKERLRRRLATVHRTREGRNQGLLASLACRRFTWLDTWKRIQPHFVNWRGRGEGENLVEFCWKRLGGEKYCTN